MPAALNRQEMGAFDRSLRRPEGCLPQAAFEVAYHELCTRIWIELELLAVAAAHVAGGLPCDLVIKAAILRLELLVLIDSARSTNWRSMLSAEQSHTLCSMLTDVLAALDVDPEHLLTVITEAQDRVLS